MTPQQESARGRAADSRGERWDAAGAMQVGLPPQGREGEPSMEACCHIRVRKRRRGRWDEQASDEGSCDGRGRLQAW